MSIEAPEALERFCDTINRAASRARQLGDAQLIKDWFAVADFLEEIRKKGVKMAKSKAISTADSNRILDGRLKQLGAKTDKIVSESNQNG